MKMQNNQTLTTCQTFSNFVKHGQTLPQLVKHDEGDTTMNLPPFSRQPLGGGGLFSWVPPGRGGRGEGVPPLTFRGRLRSCRIEKYSVNY